MKNRLIELIEQTASIKKCFHSSGGSQLLNIIYDTPNFCNWSQELQYELQQIYDRSKDTFICDILNILKQGFNGWTDKQSFNTLCGKLFVVQKNIDNYYDTDTEEVNMVSKTSKIFISHSKKDKAYVEKIVALLEDIGLNENQIFCSSVAGYDIPLDNDIFDYLRQEFQTYELHVIFILSKNYYESVPCMNEMGAAWVLKSQYTTILLPGFEFKEIEGAINPRKIALNLDSEVDEKRVKLGQLKDNLIEEFHLATITDVRWEKKREEFLEAFAATKTPSVIGERALCLLQQAANDPQGVIIKSITFSSTSITAGNTEFITSQERKKVAECEQALSELLAAGFIEPRGSKGEIFFITAAGYEYMEQLNWCGWRLD